MKRYLFVLFWTVSLMLEGCTCWIPGPTPHPPGLEEAYPTWQYIGIKSDPNGTCPDIEGWRKRQLFTDDESKPGELLRPVRGAEITAAVPPVLGADDSVSGQKADPGANDVIESLNSFCLYQTLGHPKIPTRVPGLTRFDSDPVVITVSGKTSSESLESKLQARFSARFFEQVGRSGLTLPIDSKKQRVRLTFIDSHPNSKESEPLDRACKGKYGHGDFMRLIGRALTCQNPDTCMTEIRTQLALPIRKFDRLSLKATKTDEICGGFVGSLEGLAEAIRLTVKDWLDTRGDDQHLVISLSVGWDGEKFGGLKEPMPAGAQTVYQALQYASANGALVFAATGNDKSGPNSQSGPVLPAAWEAGVPGVALKTTLVYAVGALRADNEPLSNAKRTGSMPSLAAYGDHAALGAFRPSWKTSTYTGTSVSTAVVSSIAAAVWYQNPLKSPKDVVSQLLGSGDQVKLPAASRFRGAETVQGDISPFTAKISLCKALHNARGGDLVTGCCPTPDPSPLVLSDLLNDGVRVPWEGKKLDIDRGGCLVRYYRSRKGRPLGEKEEVCASKYEDVSSFPFVYEQPGINPCPSCTDPPNRAATLRGEGGELRVPDRVLYVEIRDDWNNEIDGRLQSATFTIGATEPAASYFVEGPFDRGDRFEIRLPVEGFEFGTATQATITWKVLLDGRAYSILTPVFIAN